MKEVYERLFVSDDKFCRNGTAELAVVHACKSPCHQRKIGYTGSLPSSHPYYLVKENQFDLYLNMIDPPKPLFMPPLFERFLAFANKNWLEGRSILIHCNQGESRAPSLALLFLSKCRVIITNNSYKEAKAEFELLYPKYNPGLGIQQYFSTHWDNLGRFNPP